MEILEVASTLGQFVETLAKYGIIGMSGILPFEEGEKNLSKGDKLFVYTDGIVEYQDKEGVFYGEDRFYEELQKLKDKPIRVIVDGTIESIMEFGKMNEPRD